MSRYLERAEHTARVLDVHHNQSLELFPHQERERFRRVLLGMGVPLEGMEVLPTLDELAFDPNSVQSIAFCIAQARENARQIREQISSEMFEQLNRIFLHVRDPQTRQIYAVEPHRYYSEIKEGVHLFQGITDSTMTHGQGWQFIQVGRHLERAGALASLVNIYLLPLFQETDPSKLYLEALGALKSCTAWEAYCKVYSAELDATKLLKFLLFSREFPHAVYFSVNQLTTAFRELAESTGMTARLGLEPVVGRLLADLRYTPVEEIVFETGRPDKFLAQVRQTLNQAHSLLYRLYLSEHWERSHMS
jgi:uncharacterized alpha-E superfamily protein